MLSNFDQIVQSRNDLKHVQGLVKFLLTSVKKAGQAVLLFPTANFDKTWKIMVHEEEKFIAVI